jgi:glyoxylase-like metal-dependent hydrolase (beta-lactamase superfamily II)
MMDFTFDEAGRMIRDKMTSTPSTTVTAEGEAYLSAPRRLHFLDIEPPQQGQAIEVAPGVRWCRIPLPIDLNHINVWLIDHEDGCVLVDTGMASPVGEAAWEAMDAEVFAQTPLRAVFVTHIHPDHIGLARWLQQRHGVPVWMSKRTHEQVQAFMASDTSTGVAEAERFFTAHGIADRSMLPSLSPARFARMTSGLPEVAKHVADGEKLRWGATEWTALETNGHAEGHLCLYSAAYGALISGDQVLPTISSNIGFTWRSQDANPLHSFLTSLQRLHSLPGDTLVLPSHGLPFRGLQSRIDDLSRHHHEQLDSVQRACHDGKTALEILPVMFRRKLQGMHFFLAMAEALAHLEYLVNQSRLQRVTDAAGVIRYTAIG